MYQAIIKKTLFSAAVLFSTANVFAQTADEVVNKHIDAIGGKEAWQKVNSMKMQGTLQVQGADVDVVMTVLNGKGSRQDISVMGMTGYQILTPTAGWSYMPFQGQTTTEQITGDALKEGADSYDAQGSLIDYKAKGHMVEYLGKETVDGKECHKLKITHKSGKMETSYIDPSTNYIIRTVGKQKANGQEMEVTTSYSNYKKLPEGIVVPMSLGLPFGEMTISKVEVNVPVDEKIFKPTE